MRSILKVLLYTALLAACYWCGFSAYGDYAQLMMDDGDGLSRSARVKPGKPGKETNSPPTAANADETLPATNSPPSRKSVASAQTATTGEETDEGIGTRTNHRVGRNYLRLLGYTVGFAVSLLGLGFVAAQDFGHLLKSQLGREVSYVDARSARKAEYDRAERTALKGQHHEAIRLLQAIVAKHPGHIHSILRIAELYDKELHDFQNAALQYEQLLQLKLPPEQWGWIAIRLANIYSGKLNQPRTALELVRRLAAEHPETQAGGKALKRLSRISGAGLDAEAGKDL